MIDTQWQVYVRAIQTLQVEGPAPNLVAVNWSDLPVFFGLAVFTFEGIGLVLPIQRSMAQPEKLPTLLRIAIVFLALVFVSFGLVCYCAWGDQTDAMITFNLGSGQLTSFLRLFYSVGVFFTFPIMMFPVFQLVEQKYRFFVKHKTRRRIIFRSIVVISCVVAAIVIPDFGLFLGLIGSVACSVIAFILPSMMHLKRLDRSDATPQEDMKDKALAIAGTFAGIISFVFTLLEFFNHEEDAPTPKI